MGVSSSVPFSSSPVQPLLWKPTQRYPKTSTGAGGFNTGWQRAALRSPKVRPGCPRTTMLQFQSVAVSLMHARLALSFLIIASSPCCLLFLVIALVSFSSFLVFDFLFLVPDSCLCCLGIAGKALPLEFNLDGLGGFCFLLLISDFSLLVSCFLFLASCFSFLILVCAFWFLSLLPGRLRRSTTPGIQPGRPCGGLL